MREIFNIENKLRRLALHLKSFGSINPEETSEAFSSLNTCCLSNHEVNYEPWINHSANPAETIAYLIYNCGQCATYSNEALEQNTIKSLIQLLLKQKATFSGKASSIFFSGLSLLVKAKCIKNPINSSELNKLLTNISQLSNIQAQVYSNALYAIGRMAQENKLNGNIDAVHINSFLLVLSTIPKLKTQEISNALYGIGLLARSEQINGVISSAHVQTLLNRLTLLEGLEMRHVSTSLYGIGQIAESQKLDEAIDKAYMIPILKKLAQSADQLDARIISNSLYGIGLLARSTQLNSSIHEKSNKRFTKALNKLAKIISKKPIDYADAKQTLFGLSECNDASTSHYFAPEPLKILFEHMTRTNYLHPLDAIKLLRCFAAFQNHHEVLQAFFEKTLTAITIDFNHLDSHIQEKLCSTLVALNNTPQWKEALEQQLGLIPYANLPGNSDFLGSSQDADDTELNSLEAPWYGGYEVTDLFQAIADHNLAWLEVLLDVKAPSPKTVRDLVTAEHSTTPIQPIPRNHELHHHNQEIANHVVGQFLQETPSDALTSDVV